MPDQTFTKPQVKGESLKRGSGGGPLSLGVGSGAP